MVKNVKGDINWTGNHVFSNNITNVYINAAMDGYVTSVDATGDGYVPLFTNAKTITKDGYFYFDRTNKRLGIGTAAPQSPLHVVSDGYTLMQVSASSGGSGILAMQGRPVAATGTQTFTTNPSGSSAWTTKVVAIGDQSFQGLDQSDDGKYILCVNYNYGSNYGQVALSSDYGATFNTIAALQLTNVFWFDCCVDADGSNMAIISAYFGTSKLYVSSNYGATWTDRTSATGLSNFWCIDMDDDGSHIITCGRAEGGPLKLSTDSGATWTTKSGAGAAMASGYPESCAISGDGTKMLVLTDYYTSRMIYSTDTGENWNYATHGDGGAFGEKMAAMSRDGTVMLAITSNYTGIWVSTNSGSNWTQYSISSGYTPSSCSVNADGTKMIINTNGSKVFYSSNTGATWSDNTPSNPGYNWSKAVNISRDGNIRLSFETSTNTTLYMWVPPFRFTVGNTAVSNNDFSYGGNLEASIDNIVTAFNNKSGKNSTASKTDATHIKYTANTAGSVGNSYSTLELNDTSNSFSFGATTMANGLDAAGFLQSNGYINLGTLATPSSGYSDLGDVVAGGDLEIKGNLKVVGTTTATIAGGTTGNIQYNNGSGILAGETNLFWDATNDRLGLATTSPQNRLDVKGAMVIGSSYGGTNTAPSDGLLVQGKIGVGTTSVGSEGLIDVVSSSSNSGIIIRNDAADTSSHSVIVFKGRSSSGTGTINSYIRYKNTTSDPKLFIAVGNNMGIADGNDLFTFTRAGSGDTYRLGIGMASPSYALDVTGTTRTTTLTVSSGGASITGNLSCTTLGVSGAVQFSDGTKFVSDDSVFHWDNSNKRLGLGSNSPSQRLEVNGNVRSAGIMIYNSGSAGTPLLILGNGSGTGLYLPSSNQLGISANSTLAATFTANGTTFSTSDAQKFSINAVGFAFNRQIWDGAIYDSSKNAFQFWNDGTFHVQVYNGSGTGINDNAISINGLGRVGLSTSNPSATLDIVGDLEINGNIWNPALKTALDGYQTQITTARVGVTQQVLTASSGTYTLPTGCSAILVVCYGAGGGGGGAPASSGGQLSFGGGGAAGSRSQKLINSPSASYSYSCGASGTGGVGGNNGDAGGDTSFGSGPTLCLAKGGTGGSYVNTSSSLQMPWFGGAQSGNIGDAYGAGQPGTSGLGQANAFGITGSGGSTDVGTYGSGSGSAGNGNDATGYCAGGGGAMSFNASGAANGGVGAPGIIIVYEYY